MPTPSRLPPPSIFVTLGVYRSASTWVSNVAAEILRLSGPSRIVVADNAAEIERQTTFGAEALVVKTHRADASVRLLVRTAGLPLIVSIRDPSDCVASLIKQFQEPFEVALEKAAASCRAVLEMTACCDFLIVRYESSGRDANTVASIAERLGVVIDDHAATLVASRLTAPAVKDFIERLTVKGAFGRQPQPYYVHAATQWHPGHLGSGCVGSHRGVLTPRQIGIVQETTRAFRDHFSYATMAPDLAAIA